MAVTTTDVVTDIKKVFLVRVTIEKAHIVRSLATEFASFKSCAPVEMPRHSDRLANPISPQTRDVRDEEF